MAFLGEVTQQYCKCNQVLASGSGEVHKEKPENWKIKWYELFGLQDS